MTQKEQKQIEVNRLTVEILDLCLKAVKVAIKPRSKYKKTNDRRMGKIMVITFQIGALKAQILTVKSQPIFPIGGIETKGDEIFLKSNGKTI